MSAAWDRMVERVDTLEREAKARSPIGPQRSEWRREFKELSGALERAGRSKFTIRYGSILAVEPVFHRTTWTAPGSYATNGESVSIEGLVPTFLDAHIAPALGYTFEYDSASDKIKAFTTAGTEVVNGTDISAIGTIGVIVYGTRPVSLPGYSSAGGETLLGATLRCASGVTYHATNYWTLEVRVKRAGQTFGEEVGSRTTDTTSIADNEDVDLFDLSSGVELGPGDTVFLKATAETNATVGLGEAFLTLDIQRKVQ